MGTHTMLYHVIKHLHFWFILELGFGIKYLVINLVTLTTGLVFWNHDDVLIGN